MTTLELMELKKQHSELE
jgi:hypothetical protein